MPRTTRTTRTTYPANRRGKTLQQCRSRLQTRGVENTEEVHPRIGDIWCEKEEPNSRVVVTGLCINSLNAHCISYQELATTKQEFSSLIENFHSEYELAERGKDLCRDGTITVTECTFLEWFLNQDTDTLYIVSRTSYPTRKIIMVDGEKHLSVEDRMLWDIYRDNYLHYDKPNYGRNARIHVLKINRSDIKDAQLLSGRHFGF